MTSLIDARTFLRVVTQVLANGDAQALAHAVLDRWRPRDVAALVTHTDPDVRQAAILTMGLIGDVNDTHLLARRLHDPDPAIHQTAEHALWSVWFRGGRPDSAEPFRQGVTLLADEKYPQAVEAFTRVVAADPGFAEGYNQRALGRFLLGDYEQAGLDCCCAIKLIPLHFGALAGLGHCYAEMGDLSRALYCYRKALLVNPNLVAIARAIDRLSPRVHEDSRPASVLSMKR